MGCYGNIVMECSWRRAWLQSVTGLLDVDGLGVICSPCYNRGCPPHYYYLPRLLKVEWPVAMVIANYAYAVCAKTEGYWISDPVRSPIIGSLAPSGSANQNLSSFKEKKESFLKGKLPQRKARTPG